MEMLVVLAVMPAGKPATLIVIKPVKPFTAVVVTKMGWATPAMRETDDGVRDTVKDGGPSKFKINVVVCDIDPPAPVRVTVTLLAGVAPAVAERVTACTPALEKVRVAGDAVTPAGNPVKEPETLLVNELFGET